MLNLRSALITCHQVPHVVLCTVLKDNRDSLSFWRYALKILLQVACRIRTQWNMYDYLLQSFIPESENLKHSLSFYFQFNVENIPVSLENITSIFDTCPIYVFYPVGVWCGSSQGRIYLLGTNYACASFLVKILMFFLCKKSDQNPLAWKFYIRAPSPTPFWNPGSASGPLMGLPVGE